MALSLAQVGMPIGGSMVERRGSGVIIPFPRHKLIPLSEFRRSSGIKQERTLLTAIANSNLEAVDTYRPDMQVHRPLDFDEERMAVWGYNLTHLDRKITPELIRGSQIHRTVGYMRPGILTRLAAIYERERQRVKRFARGLYSPAEDVDRFTAARRYWGVLQQRVLFEQETPQQREKRIIWGKPIIIFDATPAKDVRDSSARLIA